MEWSWMGLHSTAGLSAASRHQPPLLLLPVCLRRRIARWSPAAQPAFLPSTSARASAAPSQPPARRRRRSPTILEFLLTFWILARSAVDLAYRLKSLLHRPRREPRSNRSRRMRSALLIEYV